ncbi:response regulator transcription factor (plasmid) [Streptomyces zhihengii]|uniref:Response regulator transcription factor n=2 Tax=Streptomyces zhihengii TaxID=1818004 RepID=A0ABS2V4Y2_9ACTN|nr:response regulator transcription factor [Streptomyces zhihengii]
MQQTIPEPRTSGVRSVAADRIIAVRLHAEDAITMAGLSHCLGQFSRFAVSDSQANTEPDVFVVAVKNVDAATLKLLDALAPRGTGRFILVVDRSWQVDVYAAVEKGVRSVLFRSNFSTAVIARTISSVAEGEGSFPSKLQGALMQQVQLVQQEVLAPRGLTSSAFSDREIDVLRYLSEGLDLDEISKKMRYSERTIKNILYSAMKHHNFHNRTQAVSHAIRAGLI